MFDYDICIIGAGAAGLAAASCLAGTDQRVLVLEKNKKSGSKLYATGNGRCNLANKVVSARNYYENFFALDVVNEEVSAEIIEYFKGIGVSTYEKNGYYYPRSNQASSVVWALNEASKKGGNVSFRYKEEVVSIQVVEKGTDNEYFEITTENDNLFTSKRLIISIGGISAKSLGAASNERSTSVFKELNLSTCSFSPALCPLETKEDVSAVAGVRTNASMYHEKSNLTDTGELQFTGFGLSGIVTFNLSTVVSDGDTILINFLPDIEKDVFVMHGIGLVSTLPEKRFMSFMNGYFNDKLCNYLFSRFGMEEYLNQKMRDISKEILEDIYDIITNVSYTVSVYPDLERAQVSRGGVLVQSINSKSMLIDGYKGLHITGEAIDVQGMCGGYNLMFAFKTGLLAAKSCLED